MVQTKWQLLDFEVTVRIGRELRCMFQISYL
jgi:hypothetical protein